MNGAEIGGLIARLIWAPLIVAAVVWYVRAARKQKQEKLDAKVQRQQEAS